MHRTRWSTLPLTALGVGGVSYVVLRAVVDRGVIVPVSGYSWAAIAIIAVVVLALGRSVRRLTEGRATRLDLIRAARVAMLAKASALGGAMLTGYFVAQTLVGWTNITAPALRDHARAAGAAALACAALAVVGLIVETWCRLPPDDTPEPA